MKTPLFYRVEKAGKLVELFDYFCNARDFAQDLFVKESAVIRIIRTDGRVMPFGVKRLCIFYKFADKWVGRHRIDWIVCKECQKKLRAGERLTQFWLNKFK